jgi:hypothetical protein
VIQDQCKDLCTQIAEKKQMRLNVEQLKRFHKIRDLFTQQVNRLGPLLSVLRTLCSAKLAQIDLSQDAKPLLMEVVAIRDRFRAKPESIIDERAFAPTPFSETVTGIGDQLEADLQTAWSKYTERKIPATNREVLDVLATAFPREVRQLRQRAERLELTRHTLPKNAQELREFDDEVAELQRAWSQLGGGDVPAAVIAFLKAAAAPTGAAIDLLTEDVRRWLTQHGIARSFAIRVANAGM